jgi:hypothetical protein
MQDFVVHTQQQLKRRQTAASSHNSTTTDQQQQQQQQQQRDRKRKQAAVVQNRRLPFREQVEAAAMRFQQALLPHAKKKIVQGHTVYQLAGTPVVLKDNCLFQVVVQKAIVQLQPISLRALLC